MPVFLELIDLTDVFNTLPEKPIIINDLDVVSKSDKEDIDNLILSVYKNNGVAFTAKCACGERSGNYLIGAICDICNTTVTKPDGDLYSRVWIRKLENTNNFFNPMFWALMSDVLKKSRYDVLQWLTNSSYKTPTQPLAALEAIQNNVKGLKRDYNWFTDNYKWVITEILQLPIYRATVNSPAYNKMHDMLTVMDIYEPVVFTEYIPIPDKSVLVIEKTNKGVYADYNISFMLDAVYSAVFSKTITRTSRVMGNRMSRILTNIKDYYSGYYNKFWSKKTGIFRRHVFSTRAYFSYRAVISQISKPHHYEELHIPWGVAMTAFRPHLINKLVELDYTLNDAVHKLYNAVTNYDAELHGIFKSLVDESPYMGIPALIQRNPTLLQGSIQRVFITVVKTDPLDTTISLSVLLVKAMGGDFDGDEMNCLLALDNKMADHWATLAPHHNVLDTNGIMNVSKMLFLPSPVLANVANWINRDEKLPNVTKETVKLMSQFN